ncbi:MAG: thioesterase domain-containing protein [bacterium]|nr:thioesterase domain-containing protein [bacterium]
MKTAVKLKQDLLDMRRKKMQLAEPSQIEGNPWILRPRPNPNAKARLFCLPYAGGAPSVFRSWPDRYFDDGIEVCLIQLPGRENRMMDTMPEDIYLLIPPIIKAMTPYLDKPYIMYGHCMGSLITHEVLRQMRNGKFEPPLHFIVGAHFGPSLLQPGGKQVSGMKDVTLEEFFKLADDLGGTDGAVLKDASTGALVIPTLKSDYYAYGSYEYRPTEKPFNIPMTVYYGNRDHLVSSVEVPCWKEETRQPCEIVEVDGDHFFVITAEDKFLPMLRKKLMEILKNVSHEDITWQ